MELGATRETCYPQIGSNRALRSKVAAWLNVSIFCALLGLIVLTVIPYGTVQPGWEAFFECTVFGLGVLWVCEGLLSGKWQVTTLEMLVPGLAIIFLALIQILPIGFGDQTAANALQAISADPFETRLFIFKLLAFLLAAELLLCYTSTRQRLKALVNVVIAVGVASALFGIARQTMQGSAIGFLLPLLEPGSGYGQFVNRNHFAFLMEMALGLVLGLLLVSGISRDRIFIYLGLAAPIWAALVLSNSRGGILSMLCQAFFLALVLVRANKPGTTKRAASVGRSIAVRLLLCVPVIVIVALGVLWLGGDTLASRLESVPKEVVTTEAIDSSNAASRENINRLQIWRATWELIKANPMMGVGFGGYWAAIAEHHDSSGEFTPQQAHNDYLELMASGGPIAIILAAWFMYAVIGRARRQLSSTDRFRRAACFGALAGLFAIAIHSFVDFGLHITANALVSIALVVIATAEQHTGLLPNTIDSDAGRQKTSY